MDNILEESEVEDSDDDNCGDQDDADGDYIDYRINRRERGQLYKKPEYDGSKLLKPVPTYLPDPVSTSLKRLRTVRYRYLPTYLPTDILPTVRYRYGTVR